jgi:hypothetical protein
VARLPEEKGQPVDPILIGNAILRPIQAVTYLVNLVDLRGVQRARREAGDSTVER